MIAAASGRALVPARSWRRWVAWALALSAIAGCGDPALWARYRAERMLWHAQRVADRADPASNDARARVAAGLQRVVDAFPPSRWAEPLTLRDPVAADVARVSGAAALRRAALSRAAGRTQEAADRYAEIARAFSALGDVAAPAYSAEARALVENGDDRSALGVWARVLERDDWVTRPEWAEASTESIRMLEESGRGADADSLRVRCIARLARAVSARGVPDPGVEPRRALAELLAQRGDAGAARAALRDALSSPGSGDRRADLVLELTERAARAGAPDTAASYGAWAAREFPPAIGFRAAVMVAGAWAAAGIADSALAVYKRVIDGAPMGAEPSLRARFERARLLELQDAWEPARSELRTLASMEPAHELGLAALVAIVRHHRSRGENELARFESRHALETVDRLLAGNRDPAVRARAMRTRAELLELTGQAAEACSAYVDLWTRFPRSAEGARAGMRAAEIADSALAEHARARELYGAVARDAADRATQRVARARLDRGR